MRKRAGRRNERDAIAADRRLGWGAAISDFRRPSAARRHSRSAASLAELVAKENPAAVAALSAAYEESGSLASGTALLLVLAVVAAAGAP